jgi:preprotein translocase subunit Sec63
LEWRRIVAGGVINKILLIVGMIILAWLAMRSVNA